METMNDKLEKIIANIKARANSRTVYIGQSAEPTDGEVLVAEIERLRHICHEALNFTKACGDRDTAAYKEIRNLLESVLVN